MAVGAACENVALTGTSEPLSVTWQVVPEPEQPPPDHVTTEPTAGVAVSLTSRPSL